MDIADLCLGATLALPLAGAVGAAILASRPASARIAASLCGLLAALAGAATGLSVLLSGRPAELDLGQGLPLASWAFRVDGLGALFLLVVASVALPAALYGLTHPRDAGAAGRLGAGTCLFLFSLDAVVAAANAYAFLVAWEVMALASLALVAWRFDRPENRRAALVYAVMTHAGTLCILAAFLLVGRAHGSLDFAAWAAVGAARPAGAWRDAAFALGLVGFGVKAGLVPLHVWLPQAHPVAPSQGSALLSGVMLKTAVYGLLRLLAGLGPAQAWWGGVLMGLAAATALLGVIYALTEHDLKRLLAYHSVENVGIILLGLGAGLLAASAGLAGLAAMALAAALYHTWNHAVFKGLLFLGAGSVIEAVGTHDMERMGGLARRMPWTAASFLVGSVAIAALPPLNGFVSEWLTFQALLGLAHGAGKPFVHLLAPVGGTALALTGALAAACFVKAYGVVFLALPRSPEAAAAGEAPASQRAALAFLALLCLALGLLPGAVLRLLDTAAAPVLGPLAGVAGTAALAVGGAGASPWQAQGWTVTLSPAALAVAAGLPALLVWAVTRRAGGRRAPTWACGIALEPRMEYTAAAFAKPFRIIFRQILRPRREIEADYEVAPYFACSLRYRSEITPVFESYLYRPAYQALLAAARRLRGLQAGSLQAYLGYILATLVVLLILAL